jgi:hypothetical protein
MIVATLLATAIFSQSPADLSPPYPEDTNCLIFRSKAPKSAPSFSDYPAAAHGVGRRARVQLKTPLAHYFRTSLRRAAKGPPDFAGDFVVAEWGCGASCTGWAVVNRATGEVFWAKGYEFIVNVHGGDEEGVFYRRDSRLIVLEGAPDVEGDNHDGLIYFVFTGKGLRRIAYYPTSKYCVPTPYG